MTSGISITPTLTPNQIQSLNSAFSVPKRTNQESIDEVMKPLGNLMNEMSINSKPQKRNVEDKTIYQTNNGVPVASNTVEYAKRENIRDMGIESVNTRPIKIVEEKQVNGNTHPHFSILHPTGNFPFNSKVDSPAFKSFNNSFWSPERYNLQRPEKNVEGKLLLSPKKDTELYIGSHSTSRHQKHLYRSTEPLHDNMSDKDNLENEDNDISNLITPRKSGFSAILEKNIHNFSNLKEKKYRSSAMDELQE